MNGRGHAHRGQPGTVLRQLGLVVLSAMIVVGTAVVNGITNPGRVIASSCGSQGFSTPTVWSSANFSGSVTTVSGDVNGDGKADLIAVNSSSVWVMLSTGSGFSAPALWSSANFSGGLATVAADVTGDGKADLVAISATFTYVMQSSGTSFLAPTLWSSSAFSGSVATFAADISGDGKADLVAVSSSYTYVMLSTGSAFSAPALWSSSSFYGSVVTTAGDVTGDGKADLVAVNAASVWIMPSTGTSFSAPALWSTSTFSGSVATLAADVNADGKSDLVAMNGNSTYVMVSSGTGFSAPVSWSSSAFSGSLANRAANITGDGDQDLVAVNGNSTYVMLSTANGCPAAPLNVSATAADARAVVSWGAPASPGSSISKYTVTPYLGSNAQTSLAVTVTATNGAGVVTTANVGGLSNGSSYTFQVTATNATGTGPPGSSSAVTPAASAFVRLAPGKGYDSGSTPVQAAIGDLTGNGWADIVTANAGANNVSALLNQVKGGGHAGGTFAQPATLSSASVSTSEVAFGDFNGDHKLDAAVVSGTSSVGVLLGNGNGTFGTETGVQTLSNQNASLVAVADMNGDGKLDIVVAGGLINYPNGTAVDVLLGNGDGTFQAPVQYSIHDYCLGCGYSSTGLALADLNGDGLPDIVYTNNNTSGGNDSGNLYALVNQGGGTFTVTPPPSGTGIPGPHSAAPGETVAVADINGDGIPDIVTMEDAVYVGLNGSGGQRGVSISFGKGDGTFLSPVYVRDPALTDGANPPNDAGDVVGVAIVDMNGDGLPDIVTGDSNSFNGHGGISVYLNPGSGNVNVPIFIPTGSFSPRGLALGDVNGDHEPDVVLENNQPVSQSVPANVLVLLNGTDFPPLGGPLAAGEMHGCAMCQAMRGGGALAVNGKYPITVNSGEMSHTFSDLSIPARGLALGVTQTYNDLNEATDAGLGYGWWSSLFMSLTQNGSTGITTVTQENGGQAQFYTASLQPVAPRTQATLVHNGDGTWTFTRYTSTTFTFSSSGRITAMADLTGDTLTFGYTGSQVTSLTHSDGRSLAIAWTSGHISSITDATVAGTTRTVSFTYDASSQLTDIDWKVNAANDRNEHFEYETTPWNHGLTGMRDPRGIWVTQVYDASGHTTSQTVDPTAKDPSGLNRTTTYAYTVSGGLISQALITDPAGNREQDTFAYGELVQKIKGYGTAAAATWTYSYDPSSVGTRMTIDPNGNTATASYDVYGNPLAATDALGRTTSYTYTGNGGADAKFNQATTSTDPNGTTTTYTHDATHRTLTQTSTPLVPSSPSVNQVIQYQHTNGTHPGDVTGMVDGDGKTWLYGYDAYGNRISTTDPLGDKASTTYNARGWVLTTITPKGDPSVCTGSCTPAQYTTTYSYVDGSGNTNFWGTATTVTDPLGHTTSKVYDSDNNVVQLTDGNGQVTTYDFDNANELTVTHRADAGHTTATTDYNADGTIHDQVDGKGNTLQSFGYNSLAQQTTVTVDPGSSPHLNLTTTYVYDGVGNVLTKQAPGGSCSGTLSGCTTYSYDAGNQLTAITYSDGATPNVSSIQYDSDGQRTAQTDGTGTWAWQYDSLHRPLSVTEGANGTVSYKYNLRNLVTQITYPTTGHVVTQGYDDSGRMNSIHDWNGATSGFKYDANSNLYESDLASGTALKDTSSYNTADQLTGIADTYNAATVFSATYTRDGDAQVTSDSSAAANQGSYGYTPLNQLCYAGSNITSACATPPTGSQPFAYDPADNLTTIGTTTQAFNTADQLTSAGATTYLYDAQGNRTRQTAGSTVTSSGYDQANRLCWNGPTAAGSACSVNAQASDTVYCYSGNGIRMDKVTAGSCTSPTSEEKFGWDVSGGLPLLIGDRSTEYVYGPRGLPLEQVSTGTLWYHHDQLGSTRVMTDVGGAVKATYTYDPYGNILACTGATVTVAGANKCTGSISVSNPLDYSAAYRDDESGLYYLSTRYYDPSTAQFLSRDAVVVLTRSSYGYVRDDPLNTIDPNGLYCKGGPYEPTSVVGSMGNFPVLCGSNGVSGAGNEGLSQSPYVTCDIDSSCTYMDPATCSGNVRFAPVSPPDAVVPPAGTPKDVSNLGRLYTGVFPPLNQLLGIYPPGCAPDGCDQPLPSYAPFDEPPDLGAEPPEEGTDSIGVILSGLFGLF